MSSIGKQKDRQTEQQLFYERFLQIYKIFWFLTRVSNNSELQGARNSAKKRTKKRTIYFPPKRAIFLIKGAHFFTLVPNFLTP